MLGLYNNQRSEQLLKSLEHPISIKGYKIVRIKDTKTNQRRKCQIMIERIDGNKIKIMDCQIVTNEILGLVKEKNDISLDKHDIEVSSPGIDRPLTRKTDLIKNKGNLIKISTLFKISNKRNFSGYIYDISDDSISIKCADQSNTISIKFDIISEIYLQYKNSKNEHKE